jgi:hypothetical protein
MPISSEDMISRALWVTAALAASGLSQSKLG